MKLTAGEAARRVGKSVPTITRAYNSGKLSGEKVEGGGYLFEESELERVYGPLHVKEGDDTPMLERETPHDVGVLQVEIEALREKLATADAERERERRQLSDQIDDLRGRLDASDEERRKAADDVRRLTLLLTDQRPPAVVAEVPQRSWWSWVTGRR